MPREVTPAKPKIKHLKLLKRMIEEDLGYTRSGSIQGTDIGQFFQRKTKRHGGITVPVGYRDNHDWWKKNIAPRASDVCHKFWEWGWVNRVEKPENAAWYNTYYSPTRQAKEFWETEGEALYEVLMAEEAAKRAEVERLCIIGKKDSRRRDKSDRRAEMLVRVVRETEKRLYVEVVHQASNSYEFDIIDGTDTKYISRDQVWKDHVSETYYHKVVEVENVIVAEKNALREQRKAEIEEINRRYNERAAQREAEYADRLLEIDPETPDSI